MIKMKKKKKKKKKKMEKKKNLRSQHCTYWATGGAEDDIRQLNQEPNPRKRSDNRNWNLTALSEGGGSKLKVLSLSYIGYCVMFFFFFFFFFLRFCRTWSNQAVPIHLG